MIRIPAIAHFLEHAVGQLNKDPGGSLTKSRIALEKTLFSLYRDMIDRPPKNMMIGPMLMNTEFKGRIPGRILARMNAVREISNLGSHGGEVYEEDALRALQDLADILEWYVARRDGAYKPERLDETREFVEILPSLRNRYKRFLKPSVVSVRFLQSGSRCWLEMTETIDGPLLDEKVFRTDLAFVSDGPDYELYFSPNVSVLQNASRFIASFDAVSIINCTELFTDKAAQRIDEHWRKYGEILE